MTVRRTNSISLSTIFATILLASLVGCKVDNSVVDPASLDNFILSFKSDNSILKLGADVLVIDSAKILLKDIKFKSEGSHDSSDIKSGLTLVRLEVSGALTQVSVSQIPSGTYDKVKFHLHKPEETEPIPDPEFREGNSSNERYSVIVKGTYNGYPFVYKSRPNAEQNIRLITPLTVQATGVVHVTMAATPYVWFNQGGAFLDPRDGNNANTIDNKIRTSFGRCFKDNDRNGEPD